GVHLLFQLLALLGELLAALACALAALVAAVAAASPLLLLLGLGRGNEAQALALAVSRSRGGEDLHDVLHPAARRRRGSTLQVLDQLGRGRRRAEQLLDVALRALQRL